MNWPWSELGLPGPAGLAAVKHAYAERLKETHPEDDPEGFQRLHRAYLAARRMAARMGEAVRAEQGGSAGEKDGWDEGGGEGGEEAAKPAEPWDFEALFAQEPGGSVPPPEGREERKKGEDRTPPGEAREWDFDRLLSQGERERAEAVRRKAEERLKGTTAEGAAEGGRGPAWDAAFAALLTLERLREENAPEADWTAFLRGGVFRGAQYIPEFVAGLTSFLKEYEDCPLSAKRLIYQSYDFGAVRPAEAAAGLRRLLKEEPGQDRTAGGGRIRKGRRAGLLLAAVFAALIVVAALRPLLSPPEYLRTMEYLEEDFGISLVSSPQNRGRDDHRYLYWPANNPDMRFQAIYEGGRDLEQGETGYKTNYTNAMLYWSMRAFARVWDEYPLLYNAERTDRTGEGASGGAPPDFFLFQLPREGAGPFFQTLEDHLDAVARNDWYQTQLPEFQLYLLHGDVMIWHYQSWEDGAFSGEEVRGFYEEEFGFELLKSLLLDHGVGRWDYPDERLKEIRSGSVLWGDIPCFWIACSGTGTLGETLTMNYYLRKDFTAIYCVPEAELRKEVITLDCTDTLELDCGSVVEVYRCS